MLFAAIVIPILSVLLLKGAVREEVQSSNGATNGAVEKTTSSSERTRSKSSPSDVISDIFVGESYTVLKTFRHDPEAFTQGLTFYGGRLYEGTGLNGKSELRELDIASSSSGGGDTSTTTNMGSVLRSTKIDNKYFGEGIAHYHGAGGAERIIQLTWKERTGFIYDAHTFEVVKHFTYETATNEGWGITYDANAKEFIVSDGSDWLHYWDRDTLEEKRRIQVTIPQLSNGADGKPQLSSKSVRYINELEMVNGFVFANVWYQNTLIAIDPQDGKTKRVYDFTNLYKDRIPAADCFNGISVTDKKNELFVTGKNWPYMYRIRLL